MNARGSTRQAWLDYAWPIASAPLAGDSHIAACEAAGGAPPIPELATADCATRLPGFIGERYEVGKGVLLVGVVLKTAEAADPAFLPAVSAAAAWARAGRGATSDASFFADTRAAYANAMPGWPVWKRFGAVLEVLGLELEDVAYTNAAKCWHTWRGYDDRNLAKNLASKCSSKFSQISSLADCIEPRQVYLAGASAASSVRRNAKLDVFIVNVVNGSVDGMEPWPNWLAEARRLYDGLPRIEASSG